MIKAGDIHLSQRGTLQTLAQGNGDAGSIQIQAGDLSLLSGADIDASNEGQGAGRGGNISIQLSGDALIEAEAIAGEFLGQSFLGGIYSIAENRGQGGDIHFSAQKLTMQNGGTIAAASLGSGNAGSIEINLSGALLMETASITAQAQQAGGGNIHIETPARIQLLDSHITARAAGELPEHAGGNVAIINNEFFIINHSQILASSVGGPGGNIHIDSRQFLPSGDSRVDASSERNIDGTVLINSPEVDLGSALRLQAGGFLRNDDLIREQCKVQIGTAEAVGSRFIVSGAQSYPSAPDELRGSVLGEE